jgi:hypothetical protein
MRPEPEGVLDVVAKEKFYSYQKSNAGYTPGISWRHQYMLQDKSRNKVHIAYFWVMTDQVIISVSK